MVTTRSRIRVEGIVQGVGFRPFAYALATRLGLGGFVGNDARGVLVEVEGDPAAIGRFRAALEREAPPLAAVALAGAVELLAAGAVVAVKGLGGYHLAADASSPAAVEALRSRKHREDKPFAVMVADLAAAARLAVVGEAEARVLAGPR